MRSPTFFIVGAPKCGTTALAAYLSEHKNVFVTKPKEPNYFTRDFSVYQQAFNSLDDYLELFESATDEHAAVGEASVWYLYSRYAAQEIVNEFPEARFIVMLRNPVDMASSLHAQMVLMQEEGETEFEKAWRLQEVRREGRAVPERCREPAFLQYRDVCSTGSQLHRLLDIVPSDQVKVVIFEEFIKAPADTYKEVLHFLSVSFDGRTNFPRINANRSAKSATLQLAVLRAPKYLRPTISAVKRMTGIRRFGILEKVIQRNMVTVARPKMRSEFRKELEAEFLVEAELVRSLISKSLPTWPGGKATI